MKIVALDCDFWALSHADEIRPVKGISLFDIIKGLSDRYKFASIPTPSPANNSGLVFEEGVFRSGTKSVQIRKIQIFPDGINISVASDSEDVDEIWQDFLSWAVSIGARDDIVFETQYHLSMIVCELERSLSRLIREADALAAFISNRLDISSDVFANGFSFSADPTTAKGRFNLNPSHFKIEQRLGTLHSANRYYSLANMTTKNHLAVLEYLENIADI